MTNMLNESIARALTIQRSLRVTLLDDQSDAKNTISSFRAQKASNLDAVMIVSGVNTLLFDGGNNKLIIWCKQSLYLVADTDLDGDEQLSNKIFRWLDKMAEIDCSVCDNEINGSNCTQCCLCFEKVCLTCCASLIYIDKNNKRAFRCPTCRNKQITSDAVQVPSLKYRGNFDIVEEVQTSVLTRLLLNAKKEKINMSFLSRLVQSGKKKGCEEDVVDIVVARENGRQTVIFPARFKNRVLQISRDDLEYAIKEAAGDGRCIVGVGKIPTMRRRRTGESLSGRFDVDPTGRAYICGSSCKGNELNYGWSYMCCAFL